MFVPLRNLRIGVLVGVRNGEDVDIKLLLVRFREERGGVLTDGYCGGALVRSIMVASVEVEIRMTIVVMVLANNERIMGW